MAITWSGTAWQPSTSYALATRVVNAGNAYQCITVGTSAASGGPTTTGSDITDNTVHWKYLGAHTGAVVDVMPDVGGTAAPTAVSQAVYLSEAEKLVADTSVWGELIDDARRYLAAHLAQLARLRGRGPVASQSAGPLSRSYAVLSGDLSLHLTAAGRRYLDLVRTTHAVFGFTA